MSCRKAFEIEVPDFLVEPAREEFAAFRAHYPGCAECASEVRAWTEVVELLRENAASGNGAHPEPAQLLRYEDDATGLAPSVRSEIERHLASCAGCRDELGALRAFPFEAGAPRPARSPLREGRWLARLRGLVLHPAFAYALVAVLLWPASLGLLRGNESAWAPPREEVAYSRERVAPAPSMPEPAAAADAAKSAPSAQVVEPKVVAPTVVARKERLAAAPRFGAAERESGASTLAGAAAEGHSLREAAPATERDLRSHARVELTSDEPVEPELRFDIPDALRGVDEIEVRVRDARGLRELRERLRAPLRSPVSIRLPSDWPLEPRYAVELRARGESGPREAVRFDVER